jgi:uncharacterized repeat protein (TIGR03803 family)
MNTARIRPHAPLPALTPRLNSAWAVAALSLPLLIGHLSFAQTVAEVYSFNEQGGPEFVTPAQGRDGRLYGTDGCGGIMSGFIFATTTAGSLTDLHDFDPAEGFCPNAGLTLATDGSFYGTTLGGGNNQNGVLFKITPKGTYTVLHFFAGGADGSGPSAAPIEASNGALYGTTEGDSTGSTIYKYTAAGGLNAIYQFDGTHGQGVIAPLIQGTDGKLYGTASSGGRTVAGLSSRCPLWESC